MMPAEGSQPVEVEVGVEVEVEVEVVGLQR